MRAGGCAVQQTLTSEAASVLKHSLTLARRRGHAQVTPLHVAATLLSSRSSLLRRACLKSQSAVSQHHPLHSRALELCFNVALNRLPTTPGPLLHAQPSLSNALIAALKRAQAHQRRGCIEQQPLLTVKVELEQLIISILDDPSVSRVMREAGFSSTAVKTNVEDAASSSVFHCYADAAVFSSPASPNAKDQNPNPSSTFWQTHFLTYSDHRNSLINPLLFSSTSTSTSPPPPKKPVPSTPVTVNDNDVKLLLQVLTREEKRKNTVIVGDGASGIAAEAMARAERGEEIRFVKLQHLSPVVLRFMKRADVETNISELKRKVDSTNATSIIYVGDLNWTVDTSSSPSPGEYNPADHMVAEVARLLMEYNNNGKKKKVWLMATASYQTYIRCQMRQPSLELQWNLHVVSVPSPDLSLTLHANSSVHDSKTGLLETKPFAKDDQQDQLCPECKSRFGEEVQLLKSSNQSKLLPPWLQPQGHEPNHKEDLEELRRKWSRLCHGLHHLRPILNTNQRVYGRSCSYNASYPWWPAKTTSSFPGSNSISFVDSPLKPNPTSNSVPRFRKQESCTIEFNFGNGTAAREQDQQPSLDCFKDSTEQGKEVRVTLELGNGTVSSDLKKVDDDKSSSDCLYKILLDNVPWQSESIGSIVEALSGSKSGKKERWLLIQGNDSIGKRRLAHTIAESICGSCDLVLHMNMRKTESESTPSSEILGRALGNHEKLVVLIEDVDLADAHFIRFLAQGFETGNFSRSCTTVFVLTKSDHMERKSQDSVIQMTLNVSRCPRSDHKRKAAEEEQGMPSKMARKGSQTEGCLRKDLSRQSSFNALDLNVLAGEEEEEESKGKSRELSPISSDLTRETALEQSCPIGFLEAIEDRFVFNRNPGREGETREGLVRRIRGSYKEVFGRGDRFSVEERVIEEVIEGSGSFVDSSFDKWLKDVFQTSLKRVRKEEEEGIAVIRLSYGGKGKQGDGVLWDGFMGSSLPKNILVVSSFD